MTDAEEIAIAKKLPKGSRKALLAMTATPTFPGKATFNANAAHNLRWTARKHGGLAEYTVRERRAAYYITPLGERIRDRLTASGMSAFGQDPKGLEAKPASPTRSETKGDAQ